MSGFQSQGPPKSLHPKEYLRYVGLEVELSIDGIKWEPCCNGAKMPVRPTFVWNHAPSFPSTIAILFFWDLNILLILIGIIKGIGAKYLQPTLINFIIVDPQCFKNSYIIESFWNATWSSPYLLKFTVSEILIQLLHKKFRLQLYNPSSENYLCWRINWRLEIFWKSLWEQ